MPGAATAREPQSRAGALASAASARNARRPSSLCARRAVAGRDSLICNVRGSGLRVRCSGIRSVLPVPFSAVLSAAWPVSVPVGAENLCHLGRCPRDRGRFGQAARRRPGRSWLGRRWDGLRLMGLKLVFLVVSRVMSLLRLSRRESWWKDAEILMLRHQLAVAERERPKARARLAWPDRAWLALLAGTVPAGRLAGMRLLVNPGTILRWHRDIVRRRWGHLSRRGRSGRPATHRKVRSVVLRLRPGNEPWGYRRIHGELAGLGITVAPSAVWEILKNAGIDPAPGRDGPGWAEF